MKKEDFEWIHSLCDNALKNNLPRILLIGDSITNNYQEMVRQKLKGIAYVDYIATSYSIDMPIYKNLIKNFANDSIYDLIQFNNGLHGKYLSKKKYSSCVTKILEKFTCKKIVLATSTYVYKEGNIIPDDSWNKRVVERNDALKEIAKENGYFITDLYPVSLSMQKDFRYSDGIHYVQGGYNILAEEVVKSMKKLI